MAEVCANLTTGNDTPGATSTTASITPSANKLILASVSIRNGASTNPTAPSLSGNGLTWVQVGTSNYDSSSGSRRAIYLFRAMGASPSTGAITITWGETETDVSWVVDEISAVDTSGTNGSGAIVQTVTNKDETGVASSLSVTLAAFSGSGNGTYGAFGTDGAITPSAGSGFTAIGHANSSINVTTDTEFRNDNDTSVDFSWVVPALMGGIAVEIKAASTTVNSGFFGLF